MYSMEAPPVFWCCHEITNKISVGGNTDQSKLAGGSADAVFCPCAWSTAVCNLQEKSVRNTVVQYVSSANSCMLYTCLSYYFCFFETFM